ncbi:DMT family transporter [Listeria aquatica]|uniref:DMT family transporter n=2 Tax=Listeria aquatica TaxID=1494960 RepID=A0A841ZIW8_9LIST|nr:DMT family transporter [Listeria aquatica]MBC1520066.1 DMT family transporter [Listeria aquatica]
MIIFYVMAGVLAGMMLPVQTSVNNRLKGYTQSPFIASFISFAVGSTVLLLLTLLTFHNFGIIPEAIAANPWWIWFGGGALGIIFLTNNILLLPRLGSALTVMVTVCGQMVMAILIDQFGWFNLPVHELNLERLLGMALMFFGVFLMQRF